MSAMKPVFAEDEAGKYCIGYDEEKAANGNTAPSACSVCSAVRAKIENALNYLENAPHAEFTRANVVGFAESILSTMNETQNANMPPEKGVMPKQGGIYLHFTDVESAKALRLTLDEAIAEMSNAGVESRRDSDVNSTALLDCPFCGDHGVEINDMSEINASKSGKPVNPFGCKNCGLFVSTREDWNTRVQSNGKDETQHDQT